MKKYKDPDTNALYLFLDDGSQDYLITDNLVRITDEETALIVKERTAKLAEEEKSRKLTPDEILARRAKLLYVCDWTQGKDIPDTISSKWVPYRQALRDITTQPGFPNEVIWPTQPV